MMGLVDMGRGRFMPGDVPISTLTLCMSGEMRLLTMAEDEQLLGEAELRPSDLMRARVGVMGRVLATEGMRWEALKGTEGRDSGVICLFSCCCWFCRSALDLCDDLELEEAVALGMVAAVHVSVTGNSSDLTLVTPPLVVVMEDGCIEGGAGGGTPLFALRLLLLPSLLDFELLLEAPLPWRAE